MPSGCERRRQRSSNDHYREALMRRFTMLLALTVGALTLMSGSAFGAAARTAASPANTSLPTIGGTARDGQTLTATSGAWDGSAPITYAYQWQRCNSSGSACAAVNKATSQNYVLSGGDVNRTLRVQVTASNADGSNQALSAATATVMSASPLRIGSSRIGMESAS